MRDYFRQFRRWCPHAGLARSEFGFAGSGSPRRPANSGMPKNARPFQRPVHQGSRSSRTAWRTFCSDTGSATYPVAVGTQPGGFELAARFAELTVRFQDKYMMLRYSIIVLLYRHVCAFQPPPQCSHFASPSWLGPQSPTKEAMPPWVKQGGGGAKDAERSKTFARWFHILCHSLYRTLSGPNP